MLDSLAWLDHGFGTRQSENWIPQNAFTVKQIHSNIVVECCTTQVDGSLGRADAMISRTPGAWLAIRTADCIPILMADPRTRAIAAVHAGWRGTVERIAQEAVRVLGSHFGSRPEDLVVAIGPGICAKCYEVGPEVATRFQSWFPERQDLDRVTRIDLAEANWKQLVAAGLNPASIDRGAPCTSCRIEEFHSHRRSQGKPGRMFSALVIL